MKKKRGKLMRRTLCAGCNKKLLVETGNLTQARRSVALLVRHDGAFPDVVSLDLCSACSSHVRDGAGTAHGEVVMQESLRAFARLMIRLVELDE